MGTIKAIFTFLAGVVGLADFFARRKAAKADDPLQQNRNRYDQIDKDITRGDSAAATAHADDDLAELERLRDKNQGH